MKNEKNEEIPNLSQLKIPGGADASRSPPTAALHSASRPAVPPNLAGPRPDHRIPPTHPRRRDATSHPPAN